MFAEFIPVGESLKETLGEMIKKKKGYYNYGQKKP